jgi:hypothetical protein
MTNAGRTPPPLPLFLDVAASLAFCTGVARLGAGQAPINGHWLRGSVMTT